MRLTASHGPVQSRILDNRSAAKAQQHLEFSLSDAQCPVPPTHLSFIRLAKTGGNHFWNDELNMSASDIFGSLDK
jgi:hypothetical protein